MKQTSFLLDNHRKDVWLDNEGDIWFWQGYWQVLEKDPHSIGFHPGNVGDENDFTPGSAYGPYKRLWKAPR
jgi:hypothetical protein